MMFSSMISISFIIIFLKHPLSLGFLILMHTTLISFTLYMLTNQMKYFNNFLSMSKFLFSPSFKLFMITISFLLITLIAAIKNLQIKQWPSSPNILW